MNVHPQAIRELRGSIRQDDLQFVVETLGLKGVSASHMQQFARNDILFGMLMVDPRLRRAIEQRRQQDAFSLDLYCASVIFSGLESCGVSYLPFAASLSLKVAQAIRDAADGREHFDFPRIDLSARLEDRADVCYLKLRINLPFAVIRLACSFHSSAFSSAVV